VFSSVLAIALSVSAIIVTGVGAILRRLLSRASASTSGIAYRSRFLEVDDASSRSDSLISLSRRPACVLFGIPLTELLALCVVPWP
jgi:hypothetical protein